MTKVSVWRYDDGGDRQPVTKVSVWRYDDGGDRGSQ